MVVVSSQAQPLGALGALGVMGVMWWVGLRPLPRGRSMRAPPPRQSAARPWRWRYLRPHFSRRVPSPICLASWERAAA